MFPFRKPRPTVSDLRTTEPQFDARDDDMPEVSQPAPLEHTLARDRLKGISVTELTELEARALCAREDIPVFWPRARRNRKDAA